MAFAAIYVPDFPVEALVRAEPELRERALAVVEGTPPLLTVIGANERARQCGVELGMTALQAEERLGALVSQSRNAGPSTRSATAPTSGAERPVAPLARDDNRRNPAWQIRRRSPAQEQAAHAALLDCACAFSPRVEDTAADTVLLDVAGLERLFGPAAKLAREVARRVSEVGMEANVAIAANPDAARHAARGFPGVTVIPAGKEAERLGGLPVDVLLCSTAALGCVPSELELLETLDRWGVRDLRALAALPEIAVTQRLGQEGLRLQRLARGEGSRPLRVTEPPLTFEEAVELEYPVALLEPLAFLLNRMLEQLCARLAARALAAQELRLKLELAQAEDPENPPQSRRATENFRISHGSSRIYADQIENQKSKIENADPSTHAANNGRQSLGMTNAFSASLRLCGEEFARAIKLPVPMLDAKVFLKLLQLDLQAHPPDAPVTKVWLAAEPAEPRRAQSGLFVPITPEPEKLELTLARIKAVVGRRSSVVGKNPEPRVGSPEVLDTHRPDAFRMRRFNSTESPVASRQLPAAALGTRIFRPPLPLLVEKCNGVPAMLTVNDHSSKTAEGRAVQSSIFNRQSSILWAAGPWRASGDWWSEQTWAREEWDVALQNDEGVALYRIYRDERRGAWFVEAEYD